VLTVLQEKLAEAHGLAIAASVVTAKLEDQTEDAHLVRDLGLMRLEARETRERCLTVEASFGEELAAETLAHANSTSMKGVDLLGAWFKAGTDPLSAWTFVAMGEAGEVAAWTVVEILARDGAPTVRSLAEWALPLQERHLRIALDDVAALAGGADPAAQRLG
jgi:hypothetical protein